MNILDQEKAAQDFADRWLAREGYEKGETQMFWIELLQNVFGVSNATELLVFEDRVQLSNTSFADVKIPSTRVLIEQKGAKIDLTKEIKQSDESFLTPFEQAKRYWDEEGADSKSRWIVTCNFREFHVYDMNKPRAEPTKIELKNFKKEWKYLSFLVDPKNENIHKEQELSIEAGRIVGKIYDSLLKLYGEQTEATLRAINVLCVRLVFCMYAEDAGLFPKPLQFYEYMKQYKAEDFREGLLRLFLMLNTKEKDRSKFEKPSLLEFPYVNGGLFRDYWDIPPFDQETVDLILEQGSSDFDWSDISPTIFGAVFESTLNPDTRRQGGMHYTSIDNIKKVIDPLFMDELNAEYDRARSLKEGTKRTKALLALQDKMAGLTFFDPACGSGNFLTETYLELRRLENNILRCVNQGQMTFDIADPIKVNIGQFFGIEVNDFAVTVAKTALWIAESQMMKETQTIVQTELNFLPLKTNANVHEGNALQKDWEKVVPSSKLSYIIGNPPFVGYTFQNPEQKKDIQQTFSDGSGKIDYVACWFFKAAKFMHDGLASGNSVKTSFVSTNSITQGEQVAIIWKPLYELFNIHIDFAYRTFKWASDSFDAAAVHVVIIGFSCGKNAKSTALYTTDGMQAASVINPYLAPAPVIFIEARRKPICEVSEIVKGSQPTDNGNFFFTEEEKNQFEKDYPDAKPYIKRCLGATEFINNKKRYCLWLADCPLNILRNCKGISERIANIKKFRLASPKKATRESADESWLFQEIRQPSASYIVVPRVSSENRRYIPLGFLPPDVIATDSVQVIPNGDLYTFAIVTSSVHMAWMRAVAGRLKSDYRYSNTIVYNNFPWPSPTEAQKKKIEETAQAILDARAKYPDASLADLYDPNTMPVELRKAHEANDKAVMKAYGFKSSLTESGVVAELFKRYETRVKELEN